MLFNNNYFFEQNFFLLLQLDLSLVLLGRFDQLFLPNLEHKLDPFLQELRHLPHLAQSVVFYVVDFRFMSELFQNLDLVL